jgi:uncharacterized protein (DUF427 family)
MTVRATWNGVLLAESDSTILVEDNQYFPADEVATKFLEASSVSTHCPWKGDASYYTVVAGDQRNEIEESPATSRGTSCPAIPAGPPAGTSGAC